MIATRLRYLLLQVRNPEDAMSAHEIACFERALGCGPDRIRIFDLLSGAPSEGELDAVDMVLLGGSGDHSVVGESDWLHRALDALRDIHAAGKPTFASCWGFQAMARAMGGEVIHDASRAEVGSYTLTVTEAGRTDPVFAHLGTSFTAQIGHEDHVVALPRSSTLLATSEKANHAYRFDDAPIYCTQFHPELRAADLETRLRAYPRYVEHLTGMPLEQFVTQLVEDRRAEEILGRFVAHVFG